MDTGRKRHCWECRRRSLVCDSATPACNRCIRTGVDCPGYGETKPRRLQWVAVDGSGHGRRRRARTRTSLPKRNSESDGNTTREPAGTICLADSKAPSELIVRAQDLPDAPMMTTQLELQVPLKWLSQAAEYFNMCIFPDLVPLHRIGKIRQIYPLTSDHVQRAMSYPDHFPFGMLCVTIGHRINQTRDVVNPAALTQKFYTLWGMAVRSLMDHLKTEGGCASDVTMMGIMSLMLADIQQGTLLNWRWHMGAIYEMVRQRGGLSAFAGVDSIAPLILALHSITAFGNTTCPATDIAYSEMQLSEIQFLLSQFDASECPDQTIPLPLFAEIIKINHLRAQAQAQSSDALNVELLTPQAEAIMESINKFSPDEWAQTRPWSPEDWTIIARIDQAATALYCILSLQSLSLLPDTATLKVHRAMHGEHLWALLQRGLASPAIKMSMLWPLTVLGVQAVHGKPAMRAFVLTQLPDLSRHTGSYMPYVAKRVLETFWESGETRWDACFGKAYIFTTQFAVDTSRLRI